MPVNCSNGVNTGLPIPVNKIDAHAPDVREDDDLTHPVVIPQEQPIFPANFLELSPAEQKRIKDRFRFLGIRLRFDLKNETVPISNETLGI